MSDTVKKGKIKFTFRERENKLEIKSSVNASGEMIMHMLYAIFDEISREQGWEATSILLAHLQEKYSTEEKKDDITT